MYFAFFSAKNKHMKKKGAIMDKKNKNKNKTDKKPDEMKPEPDVMAKPMAIVSMKDTKTDPNGSWTGVPENPYDKPVQDADDL